MTWYNVMRMKSLVKIIFSIVMVSSLTACQLSEPTIGVTVYPIEYLVHRIGGERVETLMLSEGITITRTNKHPEFDERLRQANVIFYFGQLEPYMPLVQSDIQNSRAQVINLTNQAGVYLFQRYELTFINNTTVVLESPYYVGQAFNLVDMYDTDPVLWLDPITMISMAVTIRDWLTQNFPEERNTFSRNFEQLEFELARLDASYQELRTRNLAFVSVTPSFGNWQKAYGIRVYPLILSRFGVLPSPSQLQVIKDRIRLDGVQYIAYEPNLTEDMQALYDEVVAELGLKVINLHNLSFLTPKDIEENKNYLTIMYENLSALEAMEP
jgi:zinc transport system substrate-binding protein